MTPKEKAKELIDAFTFRKVDGTIVRYDRTIQCALICESETIKRIRELKISLETIAECNKYSREVIHEIENYKTK